MEVLSCSFKGCRPDNEDSHKIIINGSGKNRELQNVNYYSIFDGHGGKQVSAFVCENIPDLFTKKHIKYPLDKKYVRKVFSDIQNMIQNHKEKIGVHCGSTALIVIMYKLSGKQFIDVMNLGDSRCVLCRANFAVTLTKDHKPEWPEERNRITSMGGIVYYDNPVWRVGDLSVSRAFGDLDAAPFVTSVPDVFRYKLEKEDKFIIMACDGLWDVIDNQTAVNFVLDNCYEKDTKTKISNNTKNIAEDLALFAYKKGSTDNITVIVIFV